MNEKQLLRNRTAIAAIEFKDEFEPTAEALQYLISELNQLCFYTIQKPGVEPAFRAEVQTLNAELMRVSQLYSELAELLDNSVLRQYVELGESLTHETITLQPTTLVSA